MTTTLSIDLSLGGADVVTPNVADSQALPPVTPMSEQSDAIGLSTADVSGELPWNGAASVKPADPETVAAFMAAMADPLRENVSLGKTLTSIVARMDAPEVATSVMPCENVIAENLLPAGTVLPEALVVTLVPEASTVALASEAPVLLSVDFDKSVDGASEVDSEAIAAASGAIAPSVSVATPEVSSVPLAGSDAVAALAPTTVDAVNASRTDVIVQAANAVADTLLVTPSLMRGEGEVLIQLKPDVLDGSQVHIAVKGRQLEVSFIPSIYDTAVLIEQCRPQIEAHLVSRIARFNVSVKVARKREEV